MRKFTFTALGASALLMLLPSCLDSEVDDYEAWREENDAYIKSLDQTEWLRYEPSWGPGHFVFMKWHNDRALTAGNLVPISTSTVSLKYEMEDINGTKLGNSYKSNGDSLYTSVVNKNIVGFWAAVTNMHVGDSVSMVIPYTSAYGSVATGQIKPYSNLVYHVKLVDITDYERPSN